MTKRKRELTGEEKRLWRRVAETTRTRRPLPVVDEDDQPSPGPRRAARPAPPASKPAATRTAAPLSPPADRGAEKRVRRGRIEIGGTLDLHGYTQISARAALARFLRAAQARGESAVIVVTGVGRGGEGVLKRLVPQWLAERDLRPLTSGYAQAHRSHGGAGAFYVFIKRLPG